MGSFSRASDAIKKSKSDVFIEWQMSKRSLIQILDHWISLDIIQIIQYYLRINIALVSLRTVS